MHRAARGGEGVPRFPMGAALLLVRLHVGERDAQILAAFAKHVPHAARARAVQVKDGVGEVDLGGVVGDHAGIIPPPKTSVKIGDGLFIEVH